VDTPMNLRKVAPPSRGPDFVHVYEESTQKTLCGEEVLDSWIQKSDKAKIECKGCRFREGLERISHV
jgi:hypothetical protein